MRASMSSLARLLFHLLGFALDVVFLVLVVSAWGVAGLVSLSLAVTLLRLAEGGAVRRARRRLVSDPPAAEMSADARETVTGIVRDVCAAAGRPLPEIVFVARIGEDEFQAAAAPGEGPGLLFVTPGAVEVLTRDELRAVIAHELGHLWRPRHGLTLPLTLAGAFAGSFAYQLCLALSLWGTGLAPGWRVTSWAGLVATLLLVPWLIRLAARVPLRREEYRADRMAVELGGDPAALAIAIYELERATLNAAAQRRRQRLLYPKDVPMRRAHFTAVQRRRILEGLCHPDHSVLRTLFVIVAAGGTHPALERRAQRMLHLLDRSLVPAPYGLSQAPGSPRPPAAQAAAGSG